MSIAEDVLVGEPARLGRQRASRAAPRAAPTGTPRPAEREQVLDRPARDDVGAERAHVELDRARRLVAVGEHERAVPRARPRRSRRRRAGGPMRYEIVVQQTSAVRSSIASAKRSAEIDPSASGRTCTTSAPRSSCACAIWPTVGNSYSLITMRFRPPARAASAETMRADALRDGGRDGDVVGVGVQELGEARAGRLVPLDPEVPLGPVLVPAGEPAPRRRRGRGARARPASTS